jgi:hypothetical protein
LFLDLQVRVRRLLAHRKENAPAPPSPALQPQTPPSFRYDVLVFPVVDWYDRFQRPQQLSLELAKLGARVFYFGNRFIPSLCVYEPEVTEVSPNVFRAVLPGSIHPPGIYANIPTELQVAAIA